MAITAKKNHVAILKKSKIIKESTYLELSTIINNKLRQHLM